MMGVWTVLMSAVAAFPAAPEPVTGRVVFEGKPVSGAIVAVSHVTITSKGAAYLTNHRDAGLWTSTGADGAFTLPVSGTAELVKLTITGKGAWGDAEVSSDRPGLGEIALKASAPAADARVCAVRVVGPDGEPVAGALAMPSLIFGDRMSGWSGPMPMAAAWTDGDGLANVVYSATDNPGRWEALALEVRAVAPGFAPTAARVEFGEAPRELRLSRGCRVVGKVVGENGPVAGAWIDLMPSGLAGDTAFMRQRAQTDGSGRFVFDHVPPETEVWISGGAWDNSAGLAARPIKVKTLVAGEELDAGRMDAVAGRRIAGRAVVRGGGALPSHTWASLEHEHAWLGWCVPLGEDGTFDFTGVPDGGPYLLTVRAHGLMISTANAAAKEGYYMSLWGMVTKDHPALEIELVEYNAENMKMGREDVQPRDKPMRGVEGGRAQ